MRGVEQIVGRERNQIVSRDNLPVAQLLPAASTPTLGGFAYERELVMTWHKIIFTADQITGDAYDRVNSAIRDAIFQDPIRYRDVAIFEGRSEFIEKYHTLNSKTSFLTPDAVATDLPRRKSAQCSL